MEALSETRPAAWLERKERLEARLAQQELHIARLQRLQDESDDPTAYSEALGRELKASAETVDHLRDLERETVILFFEREERERAGSFGRYEPKDAGVSKALQAELTAPAGLEDKTLEEIIYVLRTKQKWTWQQIADWLVAHSIKRPKGGSEWHTSAVYAIHKKGFNPRAAA